MSYTLGSVTTRVQQRVRDTGFSSTEIHSYINDAQRDIFNEYRLPFMEANQNYTLTAGVSDITNGNGLPTNFVQAITLFDTTTGGERVIPQKDIREVDQYYADPDDTTIHPTGRPEYWYYFNETIRVYPVPSSAFTLTVRYFKSPTEMTVDGDVPEIPSAFEELLVVGAAYRVMQVKDNYDQAGVLQNKYDEILQKLVMRYSQAQVGKPTVMRINRHGLGKASF